jgi:hypothetical protein
MKAPSFKVYRSFARSLNLNSYKEWVAYTKRKDFPEHYYKKPHETKLYKEKWVSWPDFLGFDPFTLKWLSIDDAKKAVRKNKIRTQTEYLNWYRGKTILVTKPPKNIPGRPELVYPDRGWKGWPDFLGYEPEQKEK